MNKKLLSLLIAGCMVATTGFGAGCMAAPGSHHGQKAPQHREMKRPDNRHHAVFKKGPQHKEIKKDNGHKKFTQGNKHKAKYNNKKQEHKKSIKNFRKDKKQAVKNHNKSQKKFHKTQMKKHNPNRHHIKNSRKK